MAEQKPRPIEIAMANMSQDITLQPEALKPLFKKMNDLQPMFENIENSLNQAKQAVNNMLENRAKLIGSLETVLGMIEEQMPAELLEKHGKEFNKPEAK